MRQTKGEAHHKAKLTASDVSEILSSDEIAPRLAVRFGVHRNMIYSIRNGESWKHIERNGQPIR